MPLCVCLSRYREGLQHNGSGSGWCQRVLWASGFNTKGAEHWYVTNSLTHPPHKTTKFLVVQLHFHQLHQFDTIEQNSFKRGTFPSVDNPTNKTPALKYSAANPQKRKSCFVSEFHYPATQRHPLQRIWDCPAWRSSNQPSLDPI